MYKLTTICVAVLVEATFANSGQDLWTAALNGYLVGVNNAIATGANLNWKNLDSYLHGWAVTALHVAAQYNHLAIVSALLNAGANINVQDDVGRTPIWWASLEGSTDTVTMLIDHGADLNIPDQKGRTALHMAYKYPPIISALLDAGADKDQQDDYGRTAIYHASESGSLDAVTMLIDRGADIHIKANDGTIALHEASGFNHPAIIHVLLDAGADKDLQDDLGRTPIWMATWLGSTDAVTMLINCGADINIPNVSGTTPLEMASTSSRSAAVLSALLDAEANKDLQNCGKQDNEGRAPEDLFLLTCGVIMFITETLFIVLH